MPTSPLEAKNALDRHASTNPRLDKNNSSRPLKTQSVLEESEARYRRLFETAKDGILILDGDTGRITDVNPFLQDMLGYPKAELIGKALWEIGPVRDIPASQEAMRHLQNNEYIRYEDLPLQTQAGEHKQVEFVSNVYMVHGLRVIQCNIRDITVRKALEAEAQIANEKLLVLVDKLRLRDTQMQLINHMNDLLQSCLTQDEAYRVITLTAETLFPGQDGCLAILHPRDQHLEVAARWGTEEIIEPVFALEDCWALRMGSLHEIDDPLDGLICDHFIHPPQTGYICLPLTVQGGTIGVLCLMGDPTPKRDLQPDPQQLVMTFGETIKLSLSNLKLRGELRQQAIHDTLTGLFNRRYLDETLPRELYSAQRRSSPLCIAMLDLDHFKQFNDYYGHGPGDTLLREFGKILREHLRKSDIICRYGGDEFLLVLPDSTLADTRERVENIRNFIKGFQFQHGEQMLDMITLSAGIAQIAKTGSTATELLHSVDQAMYSAKQAGRDRTLLYKARTCTPMLPSLPQVAEADTPQPQDAPGECLL